jgi:carboxymethylenebutenolidase
MDTLDRDVTLTTADGTCDAAFFYPTAGTSPGVIIWADAFGLRPATREMGKRLASDGYAVLVPNPFYRVRKAPQFETARNFDFGDPAQRAVLTPLLESVKAAGAAERDAVALVDWLDAQPEVDRAKGIGVHGYCMGGALAVRSAATVPERLRACASFHGGGLVTPNTDSPHLLAPKMAAPTYFGVARSDDEKDPAAKVALKAAFDAVNLPTEVEVYPAQHGWCMPDFPIYDETQAERAWSKLLELYRGTLWWPVKR